MVAVAAASGLPILLQALLAAAGALVGAIVAVLLVAMWMWSKAFPRHNREAQAAREEERAKGQAADEALERRAAAIETRLKSEIEDALADARRGHARVRLRDASREGGLYVANGMPPGVSGVAPLGVLINWTNRVADDLDLLGVAVADLRSGVSQAVATPAGIRSIAAAAIAVIPFFTAPPFLQSFPDVVSAIESRVESQAWSVRSAHGSARALLSRPFSGDDSLMPPPPQRRVPEPDGTGNSRQSCP